MLSFWEQQSLRQYDHIIVGSGIVGLSTAISIREKRPGDRVLVLERAVLPTGASTRNAGFACIGSPTELLEYLETMSEADVAALVELRWKGLLGLRRRLGDRTIDYQERGSYELLGEKELAVPDQIGRLNALLRPVLGSDAFTMANDRLIPFGFDRGFARAMVRNQVEGELDTGKMMRALIDLAIVRGVEIKTGCSATGFTENSSGIEIMVERGAGSSSPSDTISFTARDLIICTNAFAADLVPGLELRPGRGQVILTELLPEIPFCGIFHFDRGFYYFRELQGRVLFGGGRQLDIEGESTTAFGSNPKILQDLKEKLATIILPGRETRIEMAWSGIMAFGPSRMPMVKKHSPRVLLGVRMAGMGVAVATEVGERLAGMALEE